MDRKTFLSNLLEKKNRVRVGKGWQHCLICKERFGEPSDGIEEVEHQVRLPCHKTHTMGSHCITKWLEQHNTCPICRAELFPAAVETDEDDLYDSDDSLYWEQSDGPTGLYFGDEYDDPIYGGEYDYDPIADGLEQIKDICDDLCDEHGFTALDHPTKKVADLVASRVWPKDIVQNDSSFSNIEMRSANVSFAAACVYAATWLSRQPLTSGRAGFHKITLAQIDEVDLAVSQESIRAAYRIIYEHRRDIVTADALELIDARSITTGINRLPTWRAPRPRRLCRCAHPIFVNGSRGRPRSIESSSALHPIVIPDSPETQRLEMGNSKAPPALMTAFDPLPEQESAQQRSSKRRRDTNDDVDMATKRQKR